MNALSNENRAEGLKAMRDENLTPAAKVRKQFKTGRPRRSRVVNAISAVGELCDQMDKLREMQQAAGLNPNDVYGAIVWRAVDVDGLDKTFYRHLRGPERVPAMLERLGQFNNVLVLGLMFEQWDPKTKEAAVWVFPFIADEEALELLAKARKHYISGGRTKLEN
jgi:hypothetical protein